MDSYMDMLNRLAERYKDDGPMLESLSMDEFFDTEPLEDRLRMLGGLCLQLLAEELTQDLPKDAANPHDTDGG